MRAGAGRAGWGCCRVRAGARTAVRDGTVGAGCPGPGWFSAVGRVLYLPGLGWPGIGVLDLRQFAGWCPVAPADGVSLLAGPSWVVSGFFDVWPVGCGEAPSACGAVPASCCPRPP